MCVFLTIRLCEMLKGERNKKRNLRMLKNQTTTKHHDVFEFVCDVICSRGINLDFTLKLKSKAGRGEKDQCTH